MSFGIGIGDAIAVIRLAMSIVNFITAIGSVPSELTKIVDTMNSLEVVAVCASNIAHQWLEENEATNWNGQGTSLLCVIALQILNSSGNRDYTIHPREKRYPRLR